MGKHTKHTVRANSATAYREEAQNGALARRTVQVLGAYARSLEPLSDRQVMNALRFTDPNKVRPTITGLIKMGSLKKVGDMRDPETGKRCRVVALKNRHSPQRSLNYDH